MLLTSRSDLNHLSSAVSHPPSGLGAVSGSMVPTQLHGKHSYVTVNGRTLVVATPLSSLVRPLALGHFTRLSAQLLPGPSSGERCYGHCSPQSSFLYLYSHRDFSQSHRFSQIHQAADSKVHPLTAELGEQRQEDFMFKTSLGYIRRPVSK